jgi:hypothetical protein
MYLNISKIPFLKRIATLTKPERDVKKRIPRLTKSTTPKRIIVPSQQLSRLPNRKSKVSGSRHPSHPIEKREKR